MEGNGVGVLPQCGRILWDPCGMNAAAFIQKHPSGILSTFSVRADFQDLKFYGGSTSLGIQNQKRFLGMCIALK